MIISVPGKEDDWFNGILIPNLFLDSSHRPPPPLHYRRVHITEETMQHLGGAYQVEDADGGSRDSLLEGRKTYLVIDPHKEDSVVIKVRIG